MSKEEIFIEEARKIHGDLYDYSKVNNIKNKKSLVIIICKKHGESEQSVSTHLDTYGCPKCGYEMISLSKFKDINYFLKKAIEHHGNKYDYSKVIYAGCDKKVCIICKIHGEFMQTPYSHYKSSCPECAKIESHNKLKLQFEIFLERAFNMHGDRYDYSKVKYDNIQSKIIIICKLHGDFSQVLYKHLNGRGCQKCAVITVSKKITLTLDDFLKKAYQVHGDKYDYTNSIYINGKTNITINCKKHGDFEQIAGYHIYFNSGCPKCNLCPSCQLWRTFGKLCDYCLPKSINKKYQKTKEYAVVNYLKEKLPDNEFIHNKSVGKDCTEGNLYPDIRFDCNYYQLIVEVDEHKHRGADYKCDEQRMYDIIAKLGMPCIFIRYNPDSKQSDKNVLLSKVKEYLELNDEKEIWNEFGLYTEYLFY